MTLSILLPLFVAVAGVLVYAFAKEKLIEIGRIMFFVGLFWLVAVLARTELHF